MTQGPIDLTLLIAFFQGFTLVMELFATSKPDQNLNPPTDEIDPKRHNRKPFPADRHGDLFNLAFMEQEFARAHRIDIELVAMIVGRDVELLEPSLAPLDLGIGFGDAPLALAKAFDLGTPGAPGPPRSSPRSETHVSLCGSDKRLFQRTVRNSSP